MHIITLAPRTPNSYVVASGTPADLVSCLTAQPRITALPPRSSHELARLRCEGNGLIIVYTSGSVTIQGQQQAAHRVVAPLVALPETMEAR